jgi:hypothetical protein
MNKKSPYKGMSAKQLLEELATVIVRIDSKIPEKYKKNRNEHEKMAIKQLKKATAKPVVKATKKTVKPVKRTGKK